MTNAEKLRALMKKPGAVVAPGVCDAMSARIVQYVGFQAVYMTGNGAMASLLGKPDVGLATMTEMVTRARQIAACVDIPLICDADTGYGGLGNIRRTVEEFEAAGIAGIHIEDQVMPKRCGAVGGVQVVSLAEASNRIETALNAKRDKAFTVIARTDSKDAVSFDEAIRRCQRFAEIGVDAVMVEGLESLDSVKRLVDSVKAPVLFNIFERSRKDAYNIRELEAIGVKLIINCLTSTMYTAAVLKELYSEFKATGTTEAYADKMMSMKEYTKIMGIEHELRLKGSF